MSQFQLKRRMISIKRAAMKAGERPVRAGCSTADIEKVWLSIALHTTPGIPEHMHPEIALVQAGAGMDVAGFDQFTDEQRTAVTSAYPRPDGFAHKMIGAFL